MILVDEEDQWLLDNYKWYIADHGYVMRGMYSNGITRPTYLHHYIMGNPIWEKEVIDHINRNKLDNRRSNLRYVSHSGNLINSDHPVGATGVRGVTQLRTGQYMAQVKRNGTNHYLGLFDTAEEAAEARNTWLENYDANRSQ